MKKLSVFPALLLCVCLVACNRESTPAAVRPAVSTADNTVTVPAEAQSPYGLRIDEDVLISQVTPAEDSQISLLSDYTKEFVTDYYFGKGPDSVSNKNAVMSKKGPMHREAVFSWTCAAQNATFTLAYATQADFSDVKTLETEATEVKVPDLYTGATYYWQIITLSIFIVWQAVTGQAHWLFF